MSNLDLLGPSIDKDGTSPFGPKGDYESVRAQLRALLVGPRQRRKKFVTATVWCSQCSEIVAEVYQTQPRVAVTRCPVALRDHPLIDSASVTDALKGEDAVNSIRQFTVPHGQHWRIAQNQRRLWWLDGRTWPEGMRQYLDLPIDAFCKCTRRELSASDLDAMRGKHVVS